MTTEIKTDISGAMRTLGAVRETLLAGVAVGVASRLFIEMREAFEQQRSPEREAWVELSPDYRERKAKLFPGRPILQATRSLFHSLFHEARGTRGVIGAAALHSAIHQYGGTTGRGGSAQIPARPYAPTLETAERIAAEEADAILQDAIRRSEESRS